jgi:hypothetical protein
LLLLARSSRFEESPLMPQTPESTPDTVTLASSQTVPAVVLSQGPPSNAVSLAHATGLTFASYPVSPHRAYAAQYNFNIQRQRPGRAKGRRRATLLETENHEPA